MRFIYTLEEKKFKEEKEKENELLRSFGVDVSVKYSGGMKSSEFVG